MSKPTRQYIETVFSNLSALFARKIQAVTPRGFELKIVWFVLAFGALVVLIPGLDLLPVIVASQNLQGLLLPVVLVFMVLLVNDGRIMGRHRNGRAGNVLAWTAVGLVILLDAVLLGVTVLGFFGIDVG